MKKYFDYVFDLKLLDINKKYKLEFDIQYFNKNKNKNIYNGKINWLALYEKII